MALFYLKKLRYISVSCALLLAGMASCKKDVAVDQPAASVEGPMGAIGLQAGEVLLHSITPELQMAPSENAQLSISQLTADTTKTIPVGLQYSSSNSQVVTVSTTGKVEAKSSGSAVVTATDGNNKSISLLVTVQTQDLPALTEPVFFGFTKPLLVINKEKNQTVAPRVLNRLGQVLSVPYTMTFHSGGTEKTITSNLPANYPADGLYDISGKAANKNLQGSGRAILVTPTNSILAGAKAGMFSISLMRFPERFNKNGLTSEAVHGLVYRLLPGLDQGKVVLMVNTKYEDVAVKTETAEVLAAAGTKLTSVKAGIGRWRVEQENFIGPWQRSQVFHDFSGGWICANNKKGYSIELSVPAITPHVMHGGVLGNQAALYTIYELWAGWFRPLDRAKAQFTDNVTKRVYAIADANIGPLSNCTICSSLPTELLKPGPYGELETKYDLVTGVINYVSDNEFVLQDGTLNGPVFTRGTVNLGASGPLTVTTLAPVLTSTLEADLNASTTGSPAPDKRGFCFSTKPNPDISVSFPDGSVYYASNTGTTYSMTVSQLNQTTTYYVRAFAKSSTGVVTYGSVVSFTSGLLCDTTPKLLHDNNNRITPAVGGTAFANIDVTGTYRFRPTGCYYHVYALIVDTYSPGRIDYLSLTFGERPQAGKPYKVIPYSQFGSVPASDEVYLTLRDYDEWNSGSNGETLTIGGGPSNFTITGANIKLTSSGRSGTTSIISSNFRLTSL